MDIFEILRWFGIGVIFIGITYYVFARKEEHSEPSIRSNKANALAGFAVDITQEAEGKGFDAVVGREQEIKRITQILTRRTKNNVILAGPPGVGKTAIVEGLAQKIVNGEVPEVLSHKRILSLRVSELIAGTKYRGEFEARVKKMIDEIEHAQRDIILFIDEIHTIMQTKGAEGSVNLADMLKPALARGDLQLIGATTQEEYNQFIAPDGAWERRFQIVLIDEPTVEEAINILKGIKENYEEYHGVTFTDEAIEAAVRFSHEYIKGRQLPDKAIDLIDEAGAMVNVEAGPEAHKHAAGLLHGASKHVIIRNTVPATHIVQADDIKTIVADWVGMDKKEIH